MRVRCVSHVGVSHRVCGERGPVSGLLILQPLEEQFQQGPLCCVGGREARPTCSAPAGAGTGSLVAPPLVYIPEVALARSADGSMGLLRAAGQVALPGPGRLTGLGAILQGEGAESCFWMRVRMRRGSWHGETLAPGGPEPATTPRPAG